MTETAGRRALVFDLLEVYCARKGYRLTAGDGHGHAGMVESPSGKRWFFKGTRFDLNTLGAAEIATDKAYAAAFLKAAGLTVPDGHLVFAHDIRTGRTAPQDLLDFAENQGFPLYVKPNCGREGRDVVRVDTSQTLQTALHTLAKSNDQLLVQPEIRGQELRIIVLDDDVLCAIERHPPQITGDGHRSIAEIIGADPRFDAADPRRRGKVELPVQVAQSTSFTVPPDAKVSVQLGDDTIGPVQASPAGTVAFDLRLDPRVTEGRLTGRTPHGDDVEQVVALPNAAQPVVHFAPIPLPARQGPGTHSVPVAVATWTPPGQDATAVVPAVSSGTFKAGAEREDGWVVGRFVPGPTAGEVHVTAGEAKTTLSVEQGLLRARAEVTPTELKGTGRDVTFSATALGADNGEVADTVGMRVVDGTVTARPGRRGTITTGKVRKNRDAEHVVVLAEPPGSVAKVPVQAVVPWFVTVSDDTVVLRLAAVDNLGRAVAGVPVSLEAVGGSFDGLPDTLTTDGYGMAYARLSRPDSAVGVRATAGGRSGGAALAASGVSIGGGDSNWTVALDQWKAAAPTLVVGKKAPVAVAAAVPPPTEASDTPPEGAADSPARPTKPARSPTSGAAWLRAAAAFQGGAYSLTSTQADPTVGPLDVTIDEDGLNSGGLQAFVLAWVGGGPFGVEADFRLMQGDLTAAQVFAPTAVDLADPTDPDAEATSVATNVDSTTFESNAWDLRIGGRYRVDVSGPLSGYGLVQLHRQSAGLYLWDDGAVALVDSPMLGARLGVGGLVEAGPFWLDAQLAETFAPFPIRHELEARMHLNILPAVALHAGGGMAWRSMTFEVDSSEVAYSDDRSYFAVGLGTAIR